IGNTAFSDKTLIRQMELTNPHWWSFLTRGDQYSKEKLDKSLEALRNYYQDRGYVRFKIDSTQVSLTPDRKYVNVIVRITEGPIYRFQDYKIVGNYLIPEAKLRKLVAVKPGAIFSRKAVADTGTAIGRALGNLGYAFATVNAQP